MYRRIDAHQHFWNYSEAQYPWIQPDWKIRRNFLPGDLFPHLCENRIDGCIAVQARQTVEETRWLLSLARQHDFIRGVVGWVDLRSPDIHKQMLGFRSERKLVGVRHVVQDEPDDNFMLGREFLNGIASLQEFGLVYDILIFPQQLPAAIELVRRFPNQTFVLDHLAKPFIKKQDREPWASQIRELATFENVSCKISGMVTEADWLSWKPSDFAFYMDTVFQDFGEDRVLFGSDWPVALLAGSYWKAYELVFQHFLFLNDSARDKLFGENATRIYRLPD
jgi:L-fuconolactonase